ncbi:hypothetical protein Q3G72_021117 [Acer saccharum]|nr:hypothetical protein Q3G72_021117 [Acer saccharum]
MEVLRVTGFMEGKLPCNYLGVPLHVEHLTIPFFKVITPQDFLWGVGEEVKKRKWVAWSRICLLVEEGGLEFFRHKYVGDAHLAKVCNQRGIRFWMGVMAVLPLLITNSKYLVHGGEINFWYNNWLGDESLAKITEVREALMLQVHSIFVNGRWDERKLREIVPTEIFSKIISSKVRAENIDHVLCDGEVARRVWEYFAAIFGIRLPQQRSWSFRWGGILRDARGHALVGFVHSYGVATNLVAEGLALLDGLRMAQQRGL